MTHGRILVNKRVKVEGHIEENCSIPTRLHSTLPGAGTFGSNPLELAPAYFQALAHVLQNDVGSLIKSVGLFFMPVSGTDTKEDDAKIVSDMNAKLKGEKVGSLFDPRSKVYGV